MLSTFRGRHGRKQIRPMKPKYITVHSTQNYSGDAWDHARALQRGKLRAPKGAMEMDRLFDMAFYHSADVVLQHLPTNEQGEHADLMVRKYYSIGLEMCEHRGNSRQQTLSRTTKLCASLMHQYDIPLKNVVPHYHWPRKV